MIKLTARATLASVTAAAAAVHWLVVVPPASLTTAMTFARRLAALVLRLVVIEPIETVRNRCSCDGTPTNVCDRVIKLHSAESAPTMLDEGLLRTEVRVHGTASGRASRGALAPHSPTWIDVAALRQLRQQHPEGAGCRDVDQPASCTATKSIPRM